MADTVEVKGLSDLQKLLDTLASKVEKNVMRGALRAGMKPIQAAARAKIHNVSGELSKGLAIGTRVRGARVVARLRARGAHAHIAHLVEFGTKAHFIKAPHLGALLLPGGLLVSDVFHPGAAPKPFMRPALDSQAQAAVVAAAEYIKARLTTKEGLDTAHIKIEGDE